MFKPSIVLAALAAVAACGDPAPDPESAAPGVPQRELELARVEDPSVVRAARPAASQPSPVRSREPAGDSAATVEARHPAGDPTPSAPLSSPPTDQTAEPADTSGYQPYTAADTAAESEEVPETGFPAEDAAPQPEVTAPDTSAPDTAAAAPPAPATPPARHTPPPTPSPVPPAPPAPAPTGMLGVGTVIHATLVDSIHSRHDVSGKEVQARVMEAVADGNGEVLIPAGSPVRLTVTQVKSGRGDRKGVLEIRTDSITIQGVPRRLQAAIRSVPHELRGRGVTGDEAAKVGVGAAGGAVLGRVITGETEGAVIGGVVGAAGGAVVASETAAKDVVVKARTPVALVLTAPLPIH